MGRKSKNMKRLKLAQHWAAQVEEELNVTARQFGLETVHEELQGVDKDLRGVAMNPVKKKRKRGSRDQRQQQLIQPTGQFHMLKRLFGEGYSLGKCTFPACKCKGKQSASKMASEKGQRHKKLQDEVPGNDLSAICVCCGHASSQHNVVMNAQYQDQLGLFSFVNMARVAVSVFGSAPWSLQALMALDSLCKSDNETPIELFRTKVL